jgi:hypothetical protein
MLRSTSSAYGTPSQPMPPPMCRATGTAQRPGQGRASFRIGRHVYWRRSALAHIHRRPILSHTVRSGGAYLGEVTLRRTCTGVRLSNVPPSEPHRGGDSRVGSTSGLGAKTVTPRSSSSLLSRHTQSRCRCGMGEPGCGADAGRASPVLVQMQHGGLQRRWQQGMGRWCPIVRAREGRTGGKAGGSARGFQAAALW